VRAPGSAPRAFSVAAVGFLRCLLGCNEIIGLGPGKPWPGSGPSCTDPAWSRWDPNQPRAYVPAADTVYDGSTGLTWERRPTEQPLTVTGAIERCDAITIGGYSDFRLPTRIELGSIVDYGKIDPAIDESVFDPPHGGFWTSSDSKAFLGRQILVELTRGRIDAEGMPEEEWFVRCVRWDPPDAAPCSPRYVFTSGGEAVQDTVTHLEWQSAVDTVKARTFHESMAYCDSLDLPHGGGGFRLPTVHELQSLVDENAEEVTIDRRYFADTPNQYFWTSTESLETGKAWVVDFFSGSVYAFDKDIRTSAGDRMFARCVRTSDAAHPAHPEAP
jgi:uncharacterized protein DUF1566